MQWVAKLCGVLGYLYLRLCYLTSRYLLTSQADASLRACWDRGVATVLVCWHDEFLLSLISLQTPRFRKVLFITNDSFGGVFLETFCRCLGTRYQVIRRGASREERLLGMAAGLARQGALGIAADYGPPWFSARPTAWQLARLTEGHVVATRLEPRRKLRLRMADRHVYIPLPFNRYTLVASAPLSPQVPERVGGASKTAAALSEQPGERNALSAELHRLRERSAFAAIQPPAIGPGIPDDQPTISEQSARRRQELH